MSRAASPKLSKECSSVFADVIQRLPPGNGEDTSGKSRRNRRRTVMVRKFDKIVLFALFIGASVVGYLTSTWVWQVNLFGVLLSLYLGASFVA
jgi:hypothetical protein